MISLYFTGVFQKYNPVPYMFLKNFFTVNILFRKAFLMNLFFAGCSRDVTLYHTSVP